HGAWTLDIDTDAVTSAEFAGGDPRRWPVPHRNVACDQAMIEGRHTVEGIAAGYVERHGAELSHHDSVLVADDRVARDQQAATTVDAVASISLEGLGAADRAVLDLTETQYAFNGDAVPTVALDRAALHEAAIADDDPVR